jgi:hypothetical protein
MTYSSKLTTGVMACFFAVGVFAQTPVKNFKAVDDYVKKLGPLDSMNMGTISGIVTKPFADKTEKARAIFDWITANISFDCKMARSGNTQKNTTTEVLLYRKAVGAGYAALFQDMCSSANIRCLTPDGFIKTNTAQIDDSKADINHSWAVVQLGQSPDDWFYVDPAWGSGYTDADVKVFTRSFNDAYFFADKSIFNWQHYPDNEAWKLGPAPKNKKDFFALPIIKGMAYELGLKKFSPGTGIYKVKTGQASSFSFTIDPGTVITKVALRIGEPKKQKVKEVKYTFEKGVLSLNCSFEDGEYPVTVEVNGKELATYLVAAE